VDNRVLRMACVPWKLMVPFLSKSYILWNGNEWITALTRGIKTEKKKKKKPDHLVNHWEGELQVAHSQSCLRMRTIRKKKDKIASPQLTKTAFTFSCTAVMLPLFSESTRSNHSCNVTLFSILFRIPKPLPSPT